MKPKIELKDSENYKVRFIKNNFSKNICIIEVLGFTAASGSKFRLRLNYTGQGFTSSSHNFFEKKLTLEFPLVIEDIENKKVSLKLGAFEINVDTSTAEKDDIPILFFLFMSKVTFSSEYVKKLCISQ